MFIDPKKDVIPAPYQVRGKFQPESSVSKGFWMPDQVRHDGLREFMNVL
jgi:hypothetical protein